MIIIEKTGQKIKFYNNTTKKPVIFFGRTEFDSLREFRKWCEQNGMSTDDIWVYERLMEG